MSGRGSDAKSIIAVDDHIASACSAGRTGRNRHSKDLIPKRSRGDANIAETLIALRKTWRTDGCPVIIDKANRQISCLKPSLRCMDKLGFPNIFRKALPSHQRGKITRDAVNWGSVGHKTE